MRFLLTNDDGIAASGLLALAREAMLLGDVTVIAPIHQRSAMSHSITLFHPIIVEHIPLENAFSFLPENSVVMAIHGTPADCVKLAIEELMDEPPDIVIAGLNLGANTGTDVFYSGTVGSALEGVMHGIPSFAISLDASECSDFAPFARIGMRVVKRIYDGGDSAGTLYNINVPALPISKIRGIRVTRQDLRGVVDQFERRRDPRGRLYFWIKGKPVRLEIPGGDVNRLGGKSIAGDTETLEQGFISVTPIRFDLTDYDAMEGLKDLEAMEKQLLNGETHGPLPTKDGAGFQTESLGRQKA